MSQPEQSVEDILASIKRIMVEEAPPPAASPHVPPSDADDVLELTRPLPPEPAGPPPAPRAASPEPALTAAATLDTSRQALAYLSSLKLKAGDPADDTLAALVRELLRPMLKAWLDAELPGIVERAVIREIARLTAERG